nr:glutathione S-transferase [Zeugodacus cucurbitae]
MDLYYTIESTPCRAVIMAAKTIGVELNRRKLHLRQGEHLTPEYLKINPQHKVPTLVDDGFPIWESRAILIYLVEKYGKDDSLYPKCPKKRALVNQRLYFEMNLYAQFRDYFYPQFALKLPANPDLKQKADVQLGYLNTFLDGETYVAGEHLTIADISLLSSITTMDVAGMDLDRHPNVIRWYEHCKKIVPGYDENLEGALAYMKFYN